ncbi:DUF6777 domain-containing protein [Streptomyces olivoreticuli]|uniref:DUF6777 domain-containing protein n=1 Tax=Streptomyces olivoreticuli TaxID=68246 RepID=UPI0013C35C36|nr:DUF6777 domain-containing protein [Streptomyces olivoreticuli]
MSSEPPSENRPTGPPSGPLAGQGSGSGPSRPPEPTRADLPSGTPAAPEGPSGPRRPPVPPAPPTGGTGGHGMPGEEPGGGGTPWWRSLPKVALLAGALVAAAALAVFFLRSDNSGSGEVYLQSASAEGTDPFTASTAKDTGGRATASPTAPAATGGSGSRTVQGSTPGLYGGTQNVASCDVERQIGYLTEDQTKARAFATAAGIEPGYVPEYLRGLTPLQLRTDTRVTNHGYRSGSATAYQAVLQAGTAVLVDDRGMPRVRCACGNPLGPPVATKGTPQAKGKAWRAYRSGEAVAVVPAGAAMSVMVVYDPQSGRWFERPVGTQGDSDSSTSRPSTTSPSPAQPSVPPSGPSSPKSSPSPSPSVPTPHSSPPPPSPQAPGPAYGPAARTGARP